MPISKIMQKKFTSLNTLPSLMQKKKLGHNFLGEGKGADGGGNILWLVVSTPFEKY